MTVRFTPETQRAFEALRVDERALASGLELVRLLENDDMRCVMLYGASHSGKSQAAMAARAILDPDGTASFHTSAAILNSNAPIAPSDRSAKWQTWTELADAAAAGRLPALVIIDEAGSSACPSQPLDFTMVKAKHLLQRLMDAGTKFIVIGHDDRPGKLADWAEWLSGAQREYGALMPGGAATMRRVKTLDAGDAGEEMRQRASNDVAKKNELGAQGRGVMHKPPGNAAFFRGHTWSEDQGD